MIDIKNLTDSELEELSNRIAREQSDRQFLLAAPDQANQLAEQYSKASGRELGEEWKQPVGSHDAYPSCWSVSHNGKNGVNTTPANIWEPGVSGWRESPLDGAPGEWAQPTGGHDAYIKGERILFNGTVWVSQIDANVWSPETNPAGWAQEVEEDSVTPSNFAQPTGAHDAYIEGDRVLFEGSVWESTMNGNVWSPLSYPQGWREV